MSTDREIKGTLYHIRVKGNLDPKWLDWFEGFFLISHGDDETLLIGRVVDQAALHGMLSKINRLGIHLALVVQVEHFHRGTYCPLCGHYLDFHKQ